MKVSDICKTLNDIDRLRDIMLQDKHNLTISEIQEICDLGSRLPCGLCLITNQPCPMCPIVFGGPRIFGNYNQITQEPSPDNSRESTEAIM